MRYSFLILLIVIVACKNGRQPPGKIDTLVIHDTIFIERPPSKVYSNQRFKDVMAEKVAVNKFLIRGKAQIFEASFGWVIEDGHNELKKGFEMTDEGAPAFGSFGFIVEIAKKRPNSTLHIILFETSAKDGSRQHELPVLLY